MIYRLRMHAAATRTATNVSLPVAPDDPLPRSIAQPTADDNSKSGEHHQDAQDNNR